MPRNSFRVWSGWGFVLMMKDIKKNSGKYAVYSTLVVALIMCSYFIIVSSCLSQRILAGSLLVTIIVGGFINVWRIFNSSDKLDSVVDSLDSISKRFDELKVEFVGLKKEEITQTKNIEEQRRKDEREPIKESLKRQIDKFISCWENGKEDYQKRILNGMEFQKDLLDVGNALKKQIGDDEKRLPQTIIVEANDIADDIVGLAKRMRPRVIEKENDEKDIQKYKKTIDDGNSLVEKAKELIEKLESKDE